MVKTSAKVALATTKIFRQTINPIRRKNQFGFSLLEIIITVSIMAFIAAIAVPKMSNRNNEVRALVRKFAVLSRGLKQRAKMQNSTYRLVISMSEENSDPHHEFWVEVARGEVLNNYDPKNPPSLEDRLDKKDEESKVSTPFTPDGRIMKRPEVLPTGLIFESVELGSLDRPVTSGLIYIHYFPSGFTDEAAIHLKHGEKIKWTIAIEPLTGKVDIIDEFRALEDIRAK
jgi:general secretion pathway protein H